jgi:hypothetical protein
LLLIVRPRAYVYKAFPLQPVRPSVLLLARLPTEALVHAQEHLQEDDKKN